MIEKFGPKNSNQIPIAKKFSDLQTTSELEEETAKAYFINMKDMQTEINVFYFFEDQYPLMEIVDNYREGKIESLPTEYQFGTKVFDFYIETLDKKIEAYKDHFGFEIPEEVKIQRLELEKMPDELSKSFGKSIVVAHKMIKLNDLFFPLFKHEFLRVIR